MHGEQLGLRPLSVVDFVLGLPVGEGGIHVHLNLPQLGLSDGLQRLILGVGEHFKSFDIDFHCAQAGGA